MSKYQNAYRDEPEEALEPTPVETKPSKKDMTPEEETFKKRYGDLRRHMQQQMLERDGEIEAMKAQLNDATKAQIRFPKSEEEVTAWSEKYPDVAKIIDTIAQKRVSEAVTDASKEFDKLKKFEASIKTKEAMMELKKTHPDFDSIRASKEFHDWVLEQPKYVQDALYKNNTDAKAASRAIDLYKSDKGIRKTRKKNTSAAAQAIGNSRVAAPSGGKSTFRESQVANMSAAEYDKNEVAIMEAIKKGIFDYDVTGGAR
jgi:hypothetical protein